MGTCLGDRKAAKRLDIIFATQSFSGIDVEIDVCFVLTFKAEYRIRNLLGDSHAWRWHVARGHPVRDAVGVITHWVGTVTDVDELVCVSLQPLAILSSANTQLKYIPVMTGEVSGYPGEGALQGGAHGRRRPAALCRPRVDRETVRRVPQDGPGDQDTWERDRGIPARGGLARQGLAQRSHRDDERADRESSPCNPRLSLCPWLIRSSRIPPGLDLLADE